MSADTREVRPNEQIDWAALAAYFRWHLPAHLIKGLDLSRTMEIVQCAGGHSNLTYLVRFGGAELVVRRPPLGPGAHDMAREYCWLEVLHPVFPLAPRPFLLCNVSGVIGSAFYVMERRRGIVVRREEPLQLAGHPEARRRVSEALVDALVDLHAIDVTDPPLSTLDTPAGFVARQVRNWCEQWQRAKRTSMPEMEALAAWLLAHTPADPPEPAVVHGDFRLDNILLDPLDVGRVLAVFDWETCALGDPLADLGVLLAHWEPTAPPAQRDTVTTVTDRPGWFTRDEIIERYAQRSGRDVSAIRFYETLALFMVAVMMQQLVFRDPRGQTDEPPLVGLEERIAYVVRQATAVAES